MNSHSRGKNASFNRRNGSVRMLLGTEGYLSSSTCYTRRRPMWLYLVRQPGSGTSLQRASGCATALQRLRWRYPLLRPGEYRQAGQALRAYRSAGTCGNHRESQLEVWNSIYTIEFMTCVHVQLADSLPIYGHMIPSPPSLVSRKSVKTSSG